MKLWNLFFVYRVPLSGLLLDHLVVSFFFCYSSLNKQSGVPIEVDEKKMEKYSQSDSLDGIGKILLIV